MSLTTIQRFYVNKTILITGGTGFMGSYLIEKLLRSCSGIKKMYVLFRSKSKSGEESLKEFLNNKVYNGLKESSSDVLEKVSLIKGNLEIKNLGLTDEDSERIIDEVNCVFHVGATVKFTEKLRSAILINVGGTDSVITISKKMKNLQVIYNSSNRMSQILPNPKDKFEPLSCNGVYRILCSCGLVYIGETALAFLSTNDAFKQRKIREGIEIFKHSNNFKRDQGWSHHPLWKSVISLAGVPLSPDGIGLNGQI